MENSTSTVNSICRVCLKQGNDETMVSLKRKLGFFTYGKLLRRMTGLAIVYEDDLPNKLCQTCKEMMRRIHFFTVLCRNNDKKLQTFVSLSRNDRGKCGEMICEYAIFRQYFTKESTKKCSPPTNRISIPENNGTPTNDFSMENLEFNQPELNNYNNDNDSVSSDSNPSDTNSIVISDSDNIDSFLDTVENAVTKMNTDKPVTAQPKRSTENIDAFLDSIEKVVNTKVKYRCIKKVKEQLNVKKKTFHCEICNRTLANKNTFSSHMQQHTNYQFICDQCGKGFPAKDSLNKHLLKNHDKGPFVQCSYCPFKCTKRFDLVEHIRTHTGERPFTCDKCGLTFRRKAIWKNHLVQHKEKSVCCNICQKKFRRQRELNSHLNSVHERMFLFMCSVCNTSFAKNWSVRKHMSTKHGIPRDKQGKITRVTKDSNSLLFVESNKKHNT